MSNIDSTEIKRQFITDIEDGNLTNVIDVLHEGLNPNFIIESKMIKEYYISPIGIAINCENIAMIKLLLLAGANINNNETVSSVNNAVDSTDMNVLKLVLEAKGDPNLLHEGLSPLEFVENDNMIAKKLLLAHGAKKIK